MKGCFRHVTCVARKITAIYFFEPRCHWFNCELLFFSFLFFHYCTYTTVIWETIYKLRNAFFGNLIIYSRNKLYIKYSTHKTRCNWLYANWHELDKFFDRKITNITANNTNKHNANRHVRQNRICHFKSTLPQNNLEFESLVVPKPCITRTFSAI